MDYSFDAGFGMTIDYCYNYPGPFLNPLHGVKDARYHCAVNYLQKMSEGAKSSSSHPLPSSSEKGDLQKAGEEAMDASHSNDSGSCDNDSKDVEAGFKEFSINKESSFLDQKENFKRHFFCPVRSYLHLIPDDGMCDQLFLEAFDLTLTSLMNVYIWGRKWQSKLLRMRHDVKSLLRIIQNEEMHGSDDKKQVLNLKLVSYRKTVLLMNDYLMRSWGHFMVPPEHITDGGDLENAYWYPYDSKIKHPLRAAEMLIDPLLTHVGYVETKVAYCLKKMGFKDFGKTADSIQKMTESQESLVHQLLEIQSEARKYGFKFQELYDELVFSFMVIRREAQINPCINPGWSDYPNQKSQSKVEEGEKQDNDMKIQPYSSTLFSGYDLWDQAFDLFVEFDENIFSKLKLIHLKIESTDSCLNQNVKIDGAKTFDRLSFSFWDDFRDFPESLPEHKNKRHRNDCYMSFEIYIRQLYSYDYVVF